MTIPFQGLPDTRPGYAFQTGGDGGALSGGLEAVLAALIQRQKLDQDNQQLAMQQQQVDQQGAWQRGQLEQDAARMQAAALADVETRNRKRAVGEGISKLAQPNELTLPFGAAAGIPITMPGTTLAEVLAQAPPEARAEILKEGAPLEAKRDAAALEKKQAAAKQAYLSALPPDLRALEAVRANAEEAGLDDTLTKAMLEQTYAKGANPATIKLIDRKHPEWEGLGPLQKIELFMAEEKARTALRFSRPSPRETISTDAERKSAGWYKRAAQANVRMPSIETPSWITAQIIMRDPAGTGNILAGGPARRWYQNVLQFAQAVLRKDTGATINESEIGWIMNTYVPLPGDDPDTKRQKDEAREGALDELRINAGRAWEPYTPTAGPPVDNDAWAQTELAKLRGQPVPTKRPVVAKPGSIEAKPGSIESLLGAKP
jgi:hypothetical protein